MLFCVGLKWKGLGIQICSLHATMFRKGFLDLGDNLVHDDILFDLECLNDEPFDRKDTNNEHFELGRIHYLGMT
jgi:hypothetical protein